MDDDLRMMRAFVLAMVEQRGTIDDVDVMNELLAASSSNIVPAPVHKLARDAVKSLVDDGTLVRFTSPCGQPAYQQPASGN